jgi:hypothetical protein
MNMGREQMPDTPAAEARGIALAVVRLPEATKGFILLPRRWVVARSVAFACLLLHQLRLPTLARP